MTEKIDFSKIPNEYYNGKWHVSEAEGPDVLAIVIYTEEPSPETGHIGWQWWALGNMGQAPTYEAARSAAEAAMQKLFK